MATSRQEREAQFRATYGVSSGTYYEMRRKAKSRGISGATFDKVARQGGGYSSAKQVAQVAADNVDLARFMAADKTGALRDIAFADFDSSLDYADIPDDFDWWYH